MNQTLIAGQTTTLTFGSPQAAGDPPGHVYIEPPAGGFGLEVDGPAVDGWAFSDWQENHAAGTGTAKVTLAAGQTPCTGSRVWVNSASRLVYQCLADVVAAPMVEAKPAPVISTPAVPTPAVSAPVIMQPVKIGVSLGTAGTITNAALTLGEGAASWPNVLMTPDNDSAGIDFVLTGTVPYPLPGFTEGAAAGVATFLANGVLQTRMVIVTLLGEGATN